MAFTIDELIGNYLNVRDKKNALKKEQANALKEYDNALEMIEGLLKKHLTDNNLKNTSSAEGTAFFKRVRSATIADGGAFRECVLNGNQELADFRANAEAVEDWINAHDGALPPGVNFSTSQEVFVQRK